MATLTLYDGPSGRAVWPAEPDPPGVVVTADDHEAITFALNPVTGRAAVQFVVDPGGRLLAGITLDKGDDLGDIHEVIRAHIPDASLVDPESLPPALGVLHRLGDPDPPRPDGAVRQRIRSADDQVTVGAPTAADAVGVAAFVLADAPETILAVRPASESPGAVDADVVVVVDADLDATTCLHVDADVESAADRPTKLDTTPVTDPTDLGSTTPEADGAVLRMYDASTGRLAYDSRQPRDPPDEQNDAAVRFADDGLSLFVDREAGVLRANLRAAEGVEGGFVAAYHHPDGGDDLLSSFTDELADRVARLGVEFVVDVDGTAVDYDRLADADPPQPSGLSGADWATVDALEGPLDFAAPDDTALELAAFLEHSVDAVGSVAICAAGRPNYLSGTDLVVTPERDCDAVEPRSEAAARLLDRRLRDRLVPVREQLQEVAARVDEVTGTAGARQRLFGTNLSGGALAERGLTLVPAEDRLVDDRRTQAGYLTLSLLLAAGLAYGVLVGPLTQLDPGRFSVPTGPLAGRVGIQGAYTVDGAVLVVAGLAAIPLAAYRLLAPTLGVSPLSAVVALLQLDPDRAARCFRDSPRLPAARERADDVHESLQDVAAAYERLADYEATTAGQTDDFAAFLETQLFAHSALPDVRLVPRRERWKQLLGGVGAGVLAGAVTAGVVLAVLRAAVVAYPRYPPLAVALVVSLAGVALLVGALQAVPALRRVLHRVVRQRRSASAGS